MDISNYLQTALGSNNKPHPTQPVCRFEEQIMNYTR